MKNINWNKVKETAKTVLLTLVIAWVAGFVAGVHFQQSTDKAIQTAVKLSK